MKRSVTLAFAVTLLLPAQAAAQQLPDVSSAGDILGLIRWAGVVISLFVVVGSSVALRIIGGTATRLSIRFTNRRLTIQKVESFLRFFIYIVATVLVLALSFEITARTVGVILGVFAFAIGFAMKDLLAAVIAGITIMFDRPFQVGDRVQYAGQYGDITQLGLRSVRMRTLDDNIVTIPNNKILTDVTSSGNYGALDMQVVIDFYIGADQDLEQAERLVREGMLTSRYVFLEKPVIVLVKQSIVADLVVIKLQAKGYVLDTKYEKAFETDVSKRVLTAFRNYRVDPPAAFTRPLPALLAS